MLLNIAESQQKLYMKIIHEKFRELNIYIPIKLYT